MKVGDMVIMPGSCVRRGEGNGYSPGIVVELPFVGPNGERQQTPRVAVLWAYAGGNIDWEPMHWLEVVSEAR